MLAMIACRTVCGLRNICTTLPASCERARCGWRAEIVGDFTVLEHNAANDLVRELQRYYVLVDDPLRTPQQ